MTQYFSFFNGKCLNNVGIKGDNYIENRIERKEHLLTEIDSLGYSELLKEYEYYRNNNIRELVLIYGSTLLINYKSRLGDYKWDIMENILISTFGFGIKEEQDVKHKDNINKHEYIVSDKMIKWQKYCFNELNKKYGNTFRFKKLVGMLFESRGEHDKAIEIYKKLLKLDPEDLSLRMRLICILHNKIPDLIEDHIKECIMDIDAWKFKAYHLLLIGKDYKDILYCMEELLLHEPQNLDIINTIADIYMVLGDIINSKKYFSLALNIRKTNIRALWGILQCKIKTSQFSNKGGIKSKSVFKKDKDYNVECQNNKLQSSLDKLSELVIKKLIDIYSCIEVKNNNVENETVCKKLNKPVIITPSMVASRLIDRYSNKIRNL
ncbi:hypothetical protein FG386_003680 [Cryptosporidium ryanae]|uniref:uncharacterized protein n=1 Tax=Cryptosporidium ryanae TaxID=515981 RepID=UPI00351A3B1B|nr:hypothetical protein FG386_003680 [Cryptosporidium ryanae]